jgi:CRP/FNR family transcriptional regulator, cyclic AMP receptor protein
MSVPSVNLSEVIGYVAALLVFTTFWMKTMVPLRTLGIASNVFFIVYGYMAAAYPPLLLHVLLLPLNIVRLKEMLRLTKQVEQASGSDLNMAWLKPFMSSRRVAAGEVVFRKGEVADCMFFVVSGRFLLAEMKIQVLPGAVVGELGLLSPDRARTQTLQCVEDSELLQISYDHVKQLYYQDQSFGFFFLQLATKRLFENIANLESEVARLRSLSAPPVLETGTPG